MNDIMLLLLAVLVASVQLADAYLRYLAFSRQMSSLEKHTCWQRFLVWTLLILPVYAFAFHSLEAAAAYKLLLLVGWAPLSLKPTAGHDGKEHWFWQTCAWKEAARNFWSRQGCWRKARGISPCCAMTCATITA